jgi:membrane protein DedA with SNARE-associated domain
MFEWLYHDIYNLILQAPYFWIFIFMTIESTLIPLPSEIIMPPAWYLAALWKLNIFLAIIAWILWSIFWASICYGIIYFGGEKIILKIIKKLSLEKYYNAWMNFFEKNWNITVFTSRLIPWVRHFIWFPAWLFKMDFMLFLLYTALWSSIWVSFLAFVWRYFWENQELIHRYKIYFIIWIILILSIMFYIKIKISDKLNKK